MKTHLSVIIVNWNTKELLKQCISSVYSESKKYNIEVIVADNNSADGSADMVLREFPYVRLIRNLENFGFSAANNHAINIARGKYILLLNPDTVIKNGAIDKMIDEYEYYRFNGLLTCKLLNPDGSLQKSVYNFYTFFGSLLQNRFTSKVLDKIKMSSQSSLLTWDHNSIREIDWARGAVLMFPASVVKNIGVLDENYFIYGEEIDFYYRAKKAGYKAMFLPSAEIVHYGKASSRQRRVEMFLQNYKSLYTFLKKNYSAPSYYIYRFRTMFFLLTWIAYYSAVLSVKKLTGKKDSSEESTQLKIYLKTISWHFTGSSFIHYA